jgi:quinol monooxygenase YgiN
MVRVVIERRFHKKEGVKAESLLIELRSKTLQARGYISGETLVSVEDPTVLLVISTWADEASWRAWASSHQRQEIMNKIVPLMVSPEKVSVFRVVSGSNT